MIVSPFLVYASLPIRTNPAYSISSALDLSRSFYYLFLTELSSHGPENWRYVDLEVAQRMKVDTASTANNGMIDSNITTAKFSSCKSQSCEKKVAVSRHTDKYFNFLRERSLGPHMHECVSARWGSRHSGTDVN